MGWVRELPPRSQDIQLPNHDDVRLEHWPVGMGRKLEGCLLLDIGISDNRNGNVFV